MKKPVTTTRGQRGAKGNTGTKGATGETGATGLTGATGKASEFNPNSFDSQFATVHAELAAQNTARNVRMDAQDRLLSEIRLSSLTTEAQVVANINEIKRYGETLGKVETQTTLTNGRVTKLENDRTRLMGWIAGAAFVASGATAVTVWVISHFLLK